MSLRPTRPTNEFHTGAKVLNEKSNTIMIIAVEEVSVAQLQEQIRTLSRNQRNDRDLLLQNYRFWLNHGVE